MENDYNGLEIAVIGMSCKFPQSINNEVFWENLKSGKELITFYNENELMDAGINEEVLKNPNYIRANGYLDGGEYFDAEFFGYTPDEAEIMDPQIRLFHEYSWKALEDAGCVPGKYKGLIGVYAGAAGSFEWEAVKYIKNQESWENSSNIDKDHLATKIAYKLNLKGPALTIYTACSTSLVAINSACLGILSGQCDIAIAGGVKIDLDKHGYIYQEGMIKSSDGHNRTFDEKADGTIGGSGIGVVVLKRLQDAIDEGDHIYAVVKGTATNNDGNRKVGFTAPSIEGQSEVVRSAMQMAEVEPESISYVECHGTATKLGDPLEVEGLKLAFNTDELNYCALGSVKSNVGHLDTAAGVIGFIKTVLCLKHRMLVPSLHYKNPNPKIDLKNSPFYVNTETKEWRNDKYPLRAGVTSLGVGGTNAHVILEEYTNEVTSEEKKDRIIVLSAKTKKSLETAIENLKNNLLDKPHTDLSKLAYTLQVGREEFNYRAMFVSDSINESAKILNNEITGEIKHGNIKKKNRPIVFMFSGQGSQYENMGKGLYNEEKIFRNELNKCFEILEGIIGVNLIKFLYPENGGDTDNTNSKLHEMYYSGPIKFSFEYALSKLLFYYGIEPDIYIGHSFGEYVAATLHGTFELEDALKIAVIRGRLMHESQEGAMMNVPLSEIDLKPYLNEKISLAAVNTSSLCIVSGKRQDLKELEEVLALKEVECMMLNIERAAHSYIIDDILNEFELSFSGIKLNKSDKTYFSGMLGREVKGSEICKPEYWVKHIRKEVRYFEAMSDICNKYENAIFIEVSPGNGLTLFGDDNENKKESHSMINIVKHHKNIIDDKKYFYDRLGVLWIHGLDIKWENLYETIPNKISLPTYSFKKQLHKTEGNLHRELSKIMNSNNQFGGSKKDYEDWFYIPSWRRENRIKDNLTIKSNQNYLLFSLETTLEDNIKKYISEMGSSFIEIKQGDQFLKINDNCYEINYTVKEDFDKLFFEINSITFDFDNILYLWPCYIRNNMEALFEDIEYAENICFKAIVYLMQSLADYQYLNNIKMLIVSSDLESLNGEEKICYEKSLINGFIGTIPSEFENIDCALVDILSKDISKDLIAKNILNILNRDSSVKKNNLLRDKYIWYKYYEKIALEKENKRLNYNDKNILIVGGLSGIGYEVALDSVCRHENIHLIIIGRKSIPDKKLWDEIFFKNENEDLIRILKKILRLEKNGIKITYFQCDISNSDKLNEVILEIEKSIGEINVVFNSVGVPVGGGIVGLSEDIISEEFKGKVIGTFNLINILINKENLDAFVNFSSLSSILGGFGASCYASANSFEDYITTYFSNEGKNVCSINWDRWLQTGMSINVEKRHKEETGENLKGISAEDGVRALYDILNMNNSNVITSKDDLNFLIESYDNEALDDSDASRNDTVDIEQAYNLNEEINSFHPRPNISNDYIEPKTEIEINITKIFIDFFKYDKIGIEDNFFELGGDSLKAMRLFAILRKNFGVKIGVKEVFKRPTISLLADYINNNIEEIVI